MKITWAVQHLGYAINDQEVREIQNNIMMEEWAQRTRCRVNISKHAVTEVRAYRHSDNNFHILCNCPFLHWLRRKMYHLATQSWILSNRNKVRISIPLLAGGRIVYHPRLKFITLYSKTFLGIEKSQFKRV